MVASLGLRVGLTPTRPERLPMCVGGLVAIGWAGLIATTVDVRAAPAVQAVAVVYVFGYVTGASCLLRASSRECRWRHALPS